MTFAHPILLAFAIALPAIWLLLRLTPPAPRQITFPALALLRDLATPRQTPARTPWWLLLLRLTIAALFIAALAKPLLNPHGAMPGSGPLLIAIDNDWAAARAWDQRVATLHNLIAEAERAGRDVILLPTTQNADATPLEASGPVAAQSAAALADRIAPQPWPADWTAAATLLDKLPQNLSITWLSSGLGGSAAEQFAAALQRHGALRILSDADAVPLYLLAPPNADGDELRLTLSRAMPTGPDTVSIAALDAAGNSLAQFPARFPPGTVRAEPLLDLPRDLRNRVTRLELEGAPSAATATLLDERWHRRPVGLIGDADASDHSLLSENYYLDRALKPFVDLHRGAFAALLKQQLAILIVTDNVTLEDEDAAALDKWLKQGGILIRFAGPQLGAAARDEKTPGAQLLPVTLRTGDRALGGALSWATPQTLREFPASSPFHNLAIPADVTVSRQLLAEPEADLAKKSWASLQDGTPLVTAKTVGQGYSVLFHVPAAPGWSTLPLSGLFIDMLRRLVDLGNGVTASDAAATAQMPQQIMDAFATLKSPGPAVQPLIEPEHAAPGPQHPPGYYGAQNAARAFNLGQALPPPAPFTGATESYRTTSSETDLQPILLTLAFLLTLADFALSLHLRGLLKVRTA